MIIDTLKAQRCLFVDVDAVIKRHKASATYAFIVKIHPKQKNSTYAQVGVIPRSYEYDTSTAEVYSLYKLMQFLRDIDYTGDLVLGTDNNFVSCVLQDDYHVVPRFLERNMQKKYIICKMLMRTVDLIDRFKRKNWKIIPISKAGNNEEADILSRMKV